jgi:hypothetical protein
VSEFLEHFSRIPSTEEVVTSALVRARENLLSECTPEQVALLERIKGGRDWRSDGLVMLSQTHDLVRRTVAKNRAGRPTRE